MPLRKGRSKKTISSNIEEFHHGPTYRRTAAKFGKKTADRQAIAAAESTARRSSGDGDHHTPHAAIGSHEGT